MKKLIKRILREEIEKSDRHYKMLDIISEHVQLPYFDSMEGLTIYDEDDQEYIMRKIYGYNVGVYLRSIYDRITGRPQKIYWEHHDNGSWIKFEYDDNGNRIYANNSQGQWEKREYDEDGNMIYLEDSFGKKIDNR
jgi:hypothetical protein